MLVKHERRPFRFGVTLLAGLLGCLSLMGCKDEKTGAQAPTVPAVEVAVEIVTPQKVLYTTELAGRTSGFQIAEVRPQVSGIIQKRFFEEGADVKAGDVLYQIDPATYQANLDSAKANLARAEANVAPARLKMQRFKDLVNISAVSKQEFEDAEAAYKQALADVGVNKAAVENARIRLAYTKVTSPISGRSGRSLVTPGALVTENQSSPLTTVQQLDPVYVDVTQSSTEVLRLKRSLEDGTLQRADQDHAAATLEEGHLKIVCGNRAEYDVYPGHQVRYDKSTGEAAMKKVDTKYYTFWKDGYYSFNEMSLEEVMEILSKWYNLNVFYVDDEVKEIEFSGRLKRYDDFSYLLGKFEETGAVEFIIKDKTVTVKKK